MKKRYLFRTILIMGLFFAGCGNGEDGNVAVVQEIPIETTAEIAQETTEEPADVPVLQMVEEEAFVFEDIEVEVNGDKGTVLIGTTGVPYTELLIQAKRQLAEDGWDLQIKFYEDYAQLNQDVLNGTLDAHLFAHRTYVKNYNEVNKTDLVDAVPVCYEVYGVYSKLNEDLTKISGATIALPADEEKKARALLFMHDLEWIVLKDGVGMTAIEEDIVENGKNLQFVEYTPESLEAVMGESDYSIIGADTAIVAGLDAEDDVIRAETDSDISAQTYVACLVTTQENAEAAGIKVVAEVFASAEMSEFVEDTYKGALELMK